VAFGGNKVAPVDAPTQPVLSPFWRLLRGDAGSLAVQRLQILGPDSHELGPFFEETIEAEFRVEGDESIVESIDDQGRHTNFFDNGQRSNRGVFDHASGETPALIRLIHTQLSEQYHGYLVRHVVGVFGPGGLPQD